MTITMRLAFIALAVCLCIVEGVPETRLSRSKQQRPTRGFKNVEMMTARGFGKRTPRRQFVHDCDAQVARGLGKRVVSYNKRVEEIVRERRLSFKPNKNILIARGYGKRVDSQQAEVPTEYSMENIWEMLEGSSERDQQENNDERTIESIPVDWFTNELLNNPDLAKSVVRKFIDLNEDNVLSSEELLRNVA